jgi:hypothetical protein
MEWGKVHITLKMKDKWEGKDVNTGVEGLNSNKHGK